MQYYIELMRPPNEAIKISNCQQSNARLPSENKFIHHHAFKSFLEKSSLSNDEEVEISSISEEQSYKSVDSEGTLEATPSNLLHLK